MSNDFKEGVPSPRNAFFALKTSILVAIAAEIDGILAMIGKDFENLLKMAGEFVFPSQRVVMRICSLDFDGKGMSVEFINGGKKRIWIPLSSVIGMGADNMGIKQHLIANLSGGLYRIIPTKDLY